jgi:hypothetical protein
MRRLLAAACVTIACAAPARADILVPMDQAQADHLKAYGLAFWTLQQQQTARWLLNYRGGAFLLPDLEGVVRQAALRGVTIEHVDGAGVASIMQTIADNNMDSIKLETAPRVAVYAPDTIHPWDDAVVLALAYAEIPYTQIYDEKVLAGDLSNYDWLHLHHEDFTGQYGKFFASAAATDWYQRDQVEEQARAQSLAFAKVWQSKHAVAEAIREYMAGGGFMFSMCSGSDTYDIALAAGSTDIVDRVYDGDPPDPQAQEKLDFSRTMAFTGFQLEMNPLVYEFSNIDTSNESVLRGEDNDFFTLFDFSAKDDPVPTMLTQDHTAVVRGFLGQTTGFKKTLLKQSVTILGETQGTNEAKYVHGNYGKGTFTFYGGHDPEDYQHLVGDPPTDLSLHKHSPGYRLILNNVLFPAAEKKERKT